jgi:hypothetical protein
MNFSGAKCPILPLGTLLNNQQGSGVGGNVPQELHVRILSDHEVRAFGIRVFLIEPLLNNLADLCGSASANQP